VLLAAVLTFSLAACGGQEPEADVPEEAGVAVQIQPVAEDAIATENKVSGKVSADNEYTILITSAAKCTAVYAKAGDQVQAGDILCTLDLGSALASYNAARISYSSALQSYNDQKAVLDKQVQLALDNVNNTKALFEIGAASQLEVDQAELNYQSASAGRNATLSQLEAGIQNAQSGVEQLDIALEDVDSNGNVIAPISGTLATFSAVENSFISNTMPLAVIDGPDQMKVSVSVSEALVPKLSPGDEASVYVSAIDREFTAVIRSVEQAANMQTQLYTVVLTIPADVGGLMNGMFADVTFHTDVSENAIVIPTEAILNDGSVQYVFIEENGTAKYVEITTGLTGNGVTEVLSGLAAGQSLVTVGQEYLTDGAAVRVVSLEG
jgi:RND family efflux transporter MFP subunit